MVIKFCLNLAVKSSFAYKDLQYDRTRGTGIFVLPSLRPLRDYKNYIRPTGGFNLELLTNWLKKTVLFLKLKDTSPYSLMR